MNIRINKTIFLISALLMASTMAPTLATAQEPDQTHPFLSDRFQLAVGAFARQQDFKIAAGGSGPEEEIDFDETLGVDDDDTSASLTFRWKVGSKWSLWGHSWP